MKTKITSRKLILTLLFCTLTSVFTFAQKDTYRVMEVVEVAFNSQEQYDNAYMDVDVWLELKKSGSPNEAYRIPVFWDGGNVFRARLVATSPGKWTWNIINETVENSDQAFIGKSGSFTAVAANVSGNPNNQGFIRVADNKRTLEYADGTPFFYTADTSWSALTGVFGFDRANDITNISFQDYILARKKQGFNGLNLIASFPDDTYLQQWGRNRDRPGRESGLWSTDTWGKKIADNGSTPFAMKRRGQSVTDAHPEVDYRRIVPEYWQSVDQRMQFLSDQGFVTLFESVRRHERWPFRAQAEKDAFYNYIRYLWARYGCYNMIFSWVHHDTNSHNVYPDWLELVEHAHGKLSAQLGNRMPYGQPRTAMSYNTSLRNWEKDIPDALDVQNVSNAERDETMHQWLQEIYEYRRSTKPALNLEPFYPGWGLHSGNEINPGLDDTTMAQMQMYGSVLSGGLAGHAWGDAWYAGAAASTQRRKTDGGTIVPSNDPQINALSRFGSQAMGHLRDFVLDEGHEYHRLIPAAQKHLSDSQDFKHTLSISDDGKFALGFFTADARTNPSPLPVLTNLKASETYLFEWWDVTHGGWISAGEITTNRNGRLQPPALPNNDRTKNWAYRIRSEGSVDDEASSDDEVNNDNDEVNEEFTLRINAGGGEARYNGHTFSADTFFDTGRTLNRPRTGLENPYRTFRYSTSKEMDYDIPLNDGEYTVRLHFAELWFGATDGGEGGAGRRVFDVRMENELMEDNLDVFAEVGAEAALIKTYNVRVTDGELNLYFSSLTSDGGTRHPTVNAIEIIGAGAPPETDAPAIAEGTIGYWQLDDSKGATATDSSGNQHHGTLMHGRDIQEGSIDGVLENALDFNGVDDFVGLPDVDGTVDHGFTLAAWINPESTSGDYQGIAGTSTASGFMTFVHQGSLAFALRTETGRKLERHGSIVANRWQHIAVTYDGSAMTWYINGDEVGSEAHSGQVSDFKEGYIGWSGWSEEYFEGGIDDVRLFDNALTQQQVSSLSEAGNDSTVYVASKAYIPTADAENGPAAQQTETARIGYVHPNPTPGRFRITGISTGVKQIMVNDFTHRVLINMETDSEEPELDLSAYPDGIYLVRVVQNGLEDTFKVIKE
ncbi:malectin domain-containing carbohydrate-binding protein [Pricia sp. S334]|uniref:Malectin domain-containing carbohydrate-binding protein n=1 Tax=Pricia mediterranea TaxID=3076079 RepID=A0ABU3L5K5_9FLAO|nr:LamG-like jellyroll fold domain-containing protein [Pricia sp. S334]MDT7828843.1 malectin domain-containing carbohydrate-binding protein [Pricia sp. S334]